MASWLAAQAAFETAFVIVVLFVTIQMARNWRSFWDEVVTPSDWRLSRWFGLLASVPIGVVVHEVGHIVAARTLGLTITRIEWGLNHSSVTVIGSTSVQQEWVVYVAGTFAAVVVCCAVLALAMAGRRPTVRVVLITGALVQLCSQLVVIPVLVVGRWSDWSVIYDFDATPRLSSGAAVVHMMLLAAVWLWWSTRLRWTLRAIRDGMEARRRELTSLLRNDPRNVDLRWRLGDLDGAIGDFRSASTHLARARALDAASLDVLVAQTRLAVRQRQWERVVAWTAEGLMNPAVTESSNQLLWAYRAVALAELDRPGPAIEAFGELNPPLSDHVQVRYHRGMACLAAGEVNDAEGDLRDIAVALPRRALLRTHIEARLAGRRSRWRARVLDFAARLIRPDTSLASEADLPVS